MALTVTNTNTLKLLNIVNNVSKSQSNTLTKLSTGKTINRGADNPAGLIAASSLQAELTAVDAAISNNQRADAILGVADGALGEISGLLNEVESLVSLSTSSGGLTASEIDANQAQINSALESIDRIVRTTNFNGKRLLDGSQSIDRTGVTASQITDLKIFSRGQQSSSTGFTVNVTASATRANHDLVDATSSGLNGGSQITITGKLGTATITLASSLNAATIATRINEAKDLTGVSASVSGTTGVELTSTGYGSDEFISVSVLSNTTDDAVTATSTNVTGTDASVLVNGQAAVVDGLSVSYNGGGFSVGFNLTEGFATQTSTASTFSISSSGGATFQLGVSGATRSTIGIDSVYTQNLGGGDTGGTLKDLGSGGSASLSTDTEKALNIVRQAIADVATARGRIGGFQKFQIQTSLSNLNTAKVGLTDAKSIIEDTDYATATAQLNRESVLLNSGISLLGLANQQSNQILSLLG